MAKIEGLGSLSATIRLVLTEEEAGALDAITGYGVEPFLEVFYKNMGRAYLEPYEAGLRSLFESVRTGEGSVKSVLRRAEDAREVFCGVRKVGERIGR